jgi:hypothetical protein
MNSIRSKSTAQLLTAIVLLVFTFLIFSQAGKKFTLDELDFPVVAKATSETGLPVYYRGEATAHHLGLYHPPLYIYALATQIKLFGFSENTVRAFGLACTLLTAYLALLLSRSLLPQPSQHIYRIIFLGVYLLNPYTIANATLPDIDSTILPPLMTLFALLLMKKKKNDSVLAVVFCILLWAKLTTPLALIPFSLAYWKFNGESIRNLLFRAAWVFCGGALLFLATYWIYCTSVALPFGYTFSFLVHSFTKGSASPGMDSLFTKIWGNLGHFKYLAGGITTPFLLLFLASASYFLIQKNRSAAQKDALFLVCLAAAVTLFYCSLISPFGGFFKYPFAVFQFACIGVALIVTQGFEKLEIKPPYRTAIVATLMLAFALAQMLRWHDRPSFGTRLAPATVTAIAIVAGIALGLVLARRNGWGRAAAALTLAAFAATLGTGFGIARYEALAPFPTKYSYGQMGMNEAVAYLKENINEGEIVWGMKDIGFYSGNHYVESYGFFFTPDADTKIEALVKSGVRFFVATRQIGEDNLDAYPEVQGALNNCCRLAKNFGNYYIYTAK